MCKPVISSGIDEFVEERWGPPRRAACAGGGRRRAMPRPGVRGIDQLMSRSD